MNIYLTSYGLDTRYDKYMNSYNDIINLLKNKKVAIIPNAKLLNKDRTSSKVALDEMLKNNIDARIIDIDADELYIEEYDVLYLSGGEPKNLMNSIINNELYDEIKRFINNKKIIIGQSAGAMIFCKEYFDTTTGKLLVMNNGFDYSNKKIVPHYNNLSNEIKKQIPNDVFKINDEDRLLKLI